SQRLVTVTKTAAGLRREEHGAVRFVPMQGGEP
ncbi:protein-L-isoaspartate O-methyltransferase, partial [Halobacteriales archaeon SW_12_69_24]